MGFPRPVTAFATLPLGTFMFSCFRSPVRPAIIARRLRLMASFARIRAYVECRVRGLLYRIEILSRLVREQRAGDEKDGQANRGSHHPVSFRIGIFVSTHHALIAGPCIRGLIRYQQTGSGALSHCSATSLWDSYYVLRYSVQEYYESVNRRALM